MTETHLTPAQEKIVTSDAESILVLASAGSGKTHVLTERVRFLLEREKKSHVLALTFTNKAAEEMENRLNNTIKDIHLRAFIGTIHSFCLEVIRRRGHLIGYVDMPQIFERDTDKQELIVQIIRESNSLFRKFQQKNQKEQNQIIRDILFRIGMYKKNLHGLHSEHKNDNMLLLLQEYDSLLVSQNAIDYDDVIVLTHKILTDFPHVAEIYRKQYRYIMVDESQDLNFAQYELIKALCGTDHKRVMMVGDPNQVIYGFNGSDKKYMVESFVSDFAPVTKLSLNENFRSSTAILKASNCLIADGSKMKINCSLKGLFEIKEFSDQQSEAEWIAETIEYYMEHGHSDIIGKITEDRIAVLSRTKYIFHPLEEVLQKKGISYFVKKDSGSSEFESDFIQTFDLGLRLLVNPKDQLHFMQLLNLLNLNTENITVSQNTFADKLMTLSKLIKKEPTPTKTNFEQLKNSWLDIENDINSFKNALNKLQHFLEEETEENRDLTAIEDIQEYYLLWEGYCKNVSKEARTLSHFRSQMALGITHNSHSPSGITLGTVHSVKGLGFDIVFLMGMNEGTFPDYRSFKDNNSLAEEQNNAYVALTRAKRLLFLTYPKQKRMPWGGNKLQQPSRFIELIKKSMNQKPDKIRSTNLLSINFM
ncbi:MAG: ATP-dependent helicase [Planctomycetaceae bacterium]|jgi:DNA helicase-2/ATP-dependent DNA helicase PcrA|nr:ATP-dependent helicase [Planctomycetaceae bacterium]